MFDKNTCNDLIVCKQMSFNNPFKNKFIDNYSLTNHIDIWIGFGFE